jgi:hypothetical protein
MKATAFAVLVALAPAPALADGAIAIGSCDDDGDYVYGYSYDFSNRGLAARAALAYCVKRGTDCKIVNDDLNLLCFSLAIDQAKKCGAYGWASYDTPAKAQRGAVAACQQDGGTDCKIMFLKCDAGEGGGNTPPPSPRLPRCYVGPTYTPKYELWECPP